MAARWRHLCQRNYAKKNRHSFTNFFGNLKLTITFIFFLENSLWIFAPKINIKIFRSVFQRFPTQIQFWLIVFVVKNWCKKSPSKWSKKFEVWRFLSASSSRFYIFAFSCSFRICQIGIILRFLRNFTRLFGFSKFFDFQNF